MPFVVPNLSSSSNCRTWSRFHNSWLAVSPPSWRTWRRPSECNKLAYGISLTMCAIASRPSLPTPGITNASTWRAPITCLAISCSTSSWTTEGLIRLLPKRKWNLNSYKPRTYHKISCGRSPNGTAIGTSQLRRRRKTLTCTALTSIPV